jgi:hypothetical protein
MWWNKERRNACPGVAQRRWMSADAHGKPLAGALLIPSSLRARWAIMHRPSVGEHCARYGRHGHAGSWRNNREVAEWGAGGEGNCKSAE